MGVYNRFEEKVKIVSNLENINELLEWDQEVMMPEKGNPARSQQKSVISKLRHQKLSEEELGAIIEELEQKELSREQKAELREVKREHLRAKKVSEELIEEISEKQSTSVETWRKAREENDFKVFEEDLKELVELKREYARQIDPDEEPYRVLFRDFEPYIEFENMDRMMEKLKQDIPEMIEKIRESNRDLVTDAFKGDFDKDRQREINRDIIGLMNFDWDRGRLDVSTHPFTLGNQHDARITTRYNEEDLSESIMPTIHEFGHAMYQLGLQKEEYGSPLGESRDLSIHESQSRFLENQIGRSEAFCKFLLPKLKEEFPEQFENTSPQDLYESLNQVYSDNLIRVHADELTYHLHIVVRYELERKLINGDIEVEELPELWNEKMEEYLGITPENDKEGVLQDIHWGWGSFGYFTTYSLGSLISAQLYSSMEEEVEDIDSRIESGNFEPVLEWLRENIHCHGKLYRTEELVEKATGEKPSAEPFLEYVKQKYGELYGVDL
ncbi:MAG: carboxypeptidase M32 [Candidatus Nanohaloarchaea archaeon]